MRDLDLRSTGLGGVGYFCAQNKKDAVAFAKKLGLSPILVRRAANRFWQFYIIAQGVGSEELRIWNSDGTWSDVKHPGIW